MTKSVQHVRFYLSNKLNEKGGKILGYRIKDLREEKKMSQEDLSKESGVSRTIISGLESGAIKETSTKTLKKIARALGKKVSDIFF